MHRYNGYCFEYLGAICSLLADLAGLPIAGGERAVESKCIGPGTLGRWPASSGAGGGGWGVFRPSDLQTLNPVVALVTQTLSEPSHSLPLPGLGLTGAGSLTSWYLACPPRLTPLEVCPPTLSTAGRSKATPAGMGLHLSLYLTCLRLNVCSPVPCCLVWL